MELASSKAATATEYRDCSGKGYIHERRDLLRNEKGACEKLAPGQRRSLAGRQPCLHRRAASACAALASRVPGDGVPPETESAEDGGPSALPPSGSLRPEQEEG